MNVFITGIAGFVGFHVARQLRAEGHTVVGLDNFNDYYDPNLKRARAKLLHSLGVLVYEGDILHTTVLERIIIKHDITHCLHLAAYANVRYSIKRPEPYVYTNLEGFVKLLEVLRRHLRVKLVYASSSSVYGLSKRVPFSEDDPANQPTCLYGATKKSNEMLAHSYHDLYGISATGLRFFTAYGPWGRPDMAYYLFTDAIARGKPIRLFGNGTQQRDFTYIDDIVAGTIAALNLAAPYEIFNLGGNEPHSVIELISTIEEKLGTKAQINHFPAQPGEMEITFADIRKSAQHLGYAPTTPLKLGISRFVDWYLNFSRAEAPAEVETALR